MYIPFEEERNQLVAITLQFHNSLNFSVMIVEILVWI